MNAVWRIEKEFDARVTVVGESVFAVAIHTRSDSANVDWRSDYDSHEYRRIEPPSDVVEGVRQYLRAFGLSYGAFDFSVDACGEWYFLECNPDGQWGWLYELADIPVPTAIADLLCTAK